MRVIEKDGNNNFRRKMFDLGMLLLLCLILLIWGGCCYFIVEINLNDIFLSKICV